MIIAGRVGSGRTASVRLRRNWAAKIVSVLLCFLGRKDSIPGNATIPRGFPSPREAEKFKQELDLKLAKLHFYARLPL
ncbi:MAG: hypothetical protein ACYTFG_02450 [Planctomycetota bacterium]|jgi:hypothetical protein